MLSSNNGIIWLEPTPPAPKTLSGKNKWHQFVQVEAHATLSMQWEDMKTTGLEGWTQAKEVVHTTSATPYPPYLPDVAPQASSTLLNQAHLWLFCSTSSVSPSQGATSLTGKTSIIQQEFDK